MVLVVGIMLLWFIRASVIRATAADGGTERHSFFFSCGTV
jgi:hypothetical protein